MGPEGMPVLIVLEGLGLIVVIEELVEEVGHPVRRRSVIPRNMWLKKDILPDRCFFQKINEENNAYFYCGCFE
jgi:hypothetical protein